MPVLLRTARRIIIYYRSGYVDTRRHDNASDHLSGWTTRGGRRSGGRHRSIDCAVDAPSALAALEVTVRIVTEAAASQIQLPFDHANDVNDGDAGRFGSLFLGRTVSWVIGCD